MKYAYVILTLFLLFLASFLIMRAGPNRNVDSWRYNNTYYGYSFDVPLEWRVAEDYMRKWSDRIPFGEVGASAEYVVFTRAPIEEERSFLVLPDSLVGNHKFAPGRTVFVQPSPRSISDWIASYRRLSGGGEAVIIDESTVENQTGFYVLHTDTNGMVLNTLFLSCRGPEVRSSVTGDLDLRTVIFRIAASSISEGGEILRSFEESFACQKNL